MKKLVLLISAGLLLTACSQATEEDYVTAMAEVSCLGFNVDLTDVDTFEQKMKDLDEQAEAIYAKYGIDQQKEFDTFNKKKESTEFKDQVRSKIVQLNCADEEKIEEFFGAIVEDTEVEEEAEVPVDVPKRVTLTGEYICLPHADEGEITTMECAFGLKADDGNNYALDTTLSAVSEPFANMPMNGKIEVSGLLVPIEQISSDHWKIYDIKGIMQVTEVKEL